MLGIDPGLASPVFVNQGALRLSQPGPFHQDLLAKGFSAMQFGEGVTVYNMIPPEAHQLWKVELFDLAVLPVGSHYHKVQNHLLVVLEGQVELTCGSDKTFLLSPGQSIAIPAGVVHALTPKGGAVRLLALDMPGCPFPLDSFEPEAVSRSAPEYYVVASTAFSVDNQTWLASEILQQLNAMPELDENYYLTKQKQGNVTTYDLIPEKATEGKWSLKIMEIHAGQNFCSTAIRRLVMVLNGELEMQANDTRFQLQAGQ